MANSPSHQPRISPPTNAHKLPISTFSSSNQSSTTHAPTFERLDTSALAPKPIDSCHQAQPSESQQTLHTDTASVAQNDSCLSQHRATNSLKPASNSVTDAQAPRKYRLNKISFSRDSHLWQTPDDPSLNQILEQERNAWLAQSPTDPCFSSDQDFEAQTSYSLSAYSQPADNRAKYYQRCHSLQPSPVGSLLKRKSCFQEGSMNEGSRAVASTWDTFHSECDLKYNQESRSDYLSDAEGTPRASATSRASISSSIDINEFKPLPATPSTFKSTIRRLGQKVVNTKPAHTFEHVKAPPKSEKKHRRGLKKSLSTWKIFSHSDSDVEDNSDLTTDDEFHGGKTNYSSKTIKPRSSLINNALSQNEVLDERKRKAEIAYSEQFGTARKKQKQGYVSNCHNDRLSDWDEPSDSAVSRGKGLHASSTVRKMKSILRKPSDKPEVLAYQDGHAAVSTTLSAADPHSMFLHHNRSQLRDLNRSLDSDADRFEKQSRDELEEENQRLGMMLQGEEAKTLTRRSTRHSLGNSSFEPRPDGPSHATVVTDQSDEQNDKHISAAKSTGTTVVNMRDRDKIPSVSAASLNKSATVKRSQPNFVILDDVPPVPPLPSSLPQHKVLLPVSGNVRASKETATVNRGGLMCQQYDQTVLPRPLSMVLEGIESDDEEKMSKTPRAQLDGVTDDENAKNGRCIGQVQSSHNPTSNTQHWDWPEDVF